MKSDIMVDLETMDNVMTSSIVAIGAVECDLITGLIGSTYYRVVDLNDAPGTIDADTLYWWLEQSDSARRALTIQGKESHREMCLSFTKWVNSLETHNDKLRLWGNGASFDNSILQQAFRYQGLDFPLKFWNDRDMRTIVGFYPRQLQEIWRRTHLRTGTHHNALADAKHQIRYCSDILKELEVKELY